MNGAWAEPSAGTATAGAPGYRAVDPDDEDLDLRASRDDDSTCAPTSGKAKACPPDPSGRHPRPALPRCPLPGARGRSAAAARCSWRSCWCCWAGAPAPRRRRHRPADTAIPFSSPAGGSDADNDVDAFDPCSPFASKLWLLKAAVVDSQLAPAGRAAARRLPVAWPGNDRVRGRGTGSFTARHQHGNSFWSTAMWDGTRTCDAFLAAGPARPDTGARLRRDRAPRGSAHGPRRRPRVRVRVDPRQRQIIRPRPCTRVHQVAASAEAVGRGQPLRAMPLARTVSTIAEYRRGWTGSRV